MINREKLIVCCGFESDEHLHRSHPQWVEEALYDNGKIRQPEWAGNIAEGSEGVLLIAVWSSMTTQKEGETGTSRLITRS